MPATITAAMTPLKVIAGRKDNIALLIIIKILSLNEVVLHALKFPVIAGQYLLFHPG